MFPLCMIDRTQSEPMMGFADVGMPTWFIPQFAMSTEPPKLSAIPSLNEPMSREARPGAARIGGAGSLDNLAKRLRCARCGQKAARLIVLQPI
jgi:hypothetical protein